MEGIRMNNKETIKALQNFRKAYFDLLEAWNTEEGSKILNSDISTEYYPFRESFDELDVVNWIDNITNATDFD